MGDQIIRYVLVLRVVHTILLLEHGPLYLKRETHRCGSTTCRVSLHIMPNSASALPLRIYISQRYYLNKNRARIRETLHTDR
jgi:hypothetical protein